MWRCLFLVPAVLAAAPGARIYQKRNENTTVGAPSSAVSSWNTPIPPGTAVPPSPVYITTSSDGSTQVPSSPSSDGYPLTPSLVVITTSISQQNLSSTSSYGPRISTFTPPPPYSNGTKWTTTHNNRTQHGICTGCVIGAANPITASYNSHVQGNWSSIVITETILTEFVTYLVNNATIDTVVTEFQTLNQTKTVVDMNQTITHSTPVFVIQPAPGTYLTVDAGPTYLIYSNFYGGLDTPQNSTYNPFEPTQDACRPHVTSIKDWKPTQTDHWNYFIQTLTSEALAPNATESVVPLPPDLVNFLKQDPQVQAQFSGSNIATCTFAGEDFRYGSNRSRPPRPPAPTLPPQDQTGSETATETAPASFIVPPNLPPPAFTTAFSFSGGDRTWLSTTFASTSQHITKQGCLRCDTTDQGAFSPTPAPTPERPRIDNPGNVPNPNPNNPNPNPNNPNPNPNNPNPNQNNPSPNQNNPNPNTNQPDPNSNQRNPNIIQPNPDTNQPNPNQNNPGSNPGRPNDSNPPENRPGNNPAGQPNSNESPTQDVPDIIKSIIHDNPSLTQPPRQQQQPPYQPTDSGQNIRIGDSIVNVRPAAPTQNTNGWPGQQPNSNGQPNQQNPNGGPNQQNPNGGPNQQNPNGSPSQPNTNGNPNQQNPNGSNQQNTNGNQHNPNGSPNQQNPNGSNQQNTNGNQQNPNGSPNQQNPNGSPNQQNTNGSPNQQNTNGNPNQQNTNGNPNQQNTNGNPNQQNTNGNPGQQNTNGNPGQQNTNGNPNQQNTNGNPGQQNTNGNPGQQDNGRPVVVIGSETLTSGETRTINGVPVVVPTGDGGSKIIVGGSTVNITPAPTAPQMPAITVGRNVVTANPEGNFVVGTETLRQGGPALTIDGNTLSLSPSGTIAIVNGVTQTIARGQGSTQAPILTMSGQTVPATVIGGSTLFVLDQDKTLAPGRAITVDGTTYSMPVDSQGSVVVINGQTMTLEAGRAVPFTQPVSTTVAGGTTAFVFGPGQTLTLGGVVTVSGTTIYMPTSGSGSVVVINGVTSTLGQALITSAAPLTVDGKIVTATVRDGTTEYIVNAGTTLMPDGELIISGTTYSLDPNGTVLVINGKSSTIASTPATNTARTTSASITSRENLVDSPTSNVGRTSTAAGVSVSNSGLDTWVERLVVGAAGWMLMLL